MSRVVVTLRLSNKTEYKRFMRLLRNFLFLRFSAQQNGKRWSWGALVILLAAGWLAPGSQVAQAQVAPYCNFSAEEITQKQALLVESLRGDRRATRAYENLIRQHGDRMQRCRSQTWLQNQAVWVRLYPCDARNGGIEYLLDQMVNRGYSQVYIEAFGGGQVLLPRNDNPTPWSSVIRAPGFEDRDLLAEVIEKGRDRGMKVYAWMFSMNFGYTYAQRPGAQQNLAVNGRGQDSLMAESTGAINPDEIFIDPYSPQAKADFYTLAQAVTRRRPDGVLFDYIRYPKGTGQASIASRVQDLWVYGPASQQALLQRALNPSGLDLIRRFLQRGSITTQDIADMSTRYPQDIAPQWQGFAANPGYATATPEQRRPFIETQLWQLSLSHAFQGVLDFLNTGVSPAAQRGIPAGVVFFPEGNQMIGTSSYDSRLQFWDRFPAALEWHPMAYSTCGNASCIVRQVQRVLSMAPVGTKVMPVLAGTWGKPVSNRPSLEVQMQAIRQVAPQIDSISHFAFSWQDPQGDRDRKFCQLP